MADDLLTGDWSQHFAKSYYGPDYVSAGYNSFLSKSIDLTAQQTPDPSQVSLNTPNQYQNNSINYDFSQVSGAVGDSIRIGNIVIDGTIGRITIYDGSEIEVVRIGSLDD